MHLKSQYASRSREGWRRFTGAGFLTAAIALSFAVIALTPSSAQARYASIVIDAESGKVLHARNADTRNYPASLTKIMTLYLLFDALDRGRVTLGTPFKVSRRASGQAPSKLGLKVGQTIRVRDAILALVTKSANDVATVVAENLATTEIEFAIRMTDKARELGMNRTSFRNASGLPNRRQRSTARDMATLAVAIQRDFPQYYALFSTKRFTYKGRTHRNHNKLLGRYKGVDGIKTGYIRASGFNLVASAERNGRRLVGVVFGGRAPKSRDRHMAKLLDSGFKKATQVAGVGRAPLPRPRPGSEAPTPIPLKTVKQPRQQTRPQTRPQPVSDGNWGIQVGAYSEALPAQRMVRNARSHLPKLLAQAKYSVEYVTRDHGAIYRARLVGLDEDTARRACTVLTRRHLPCVPISAPQPITVALAPK